MKEISLNDLSKFHFLYSRSGEQKRMLARVQFGMKNGETGATLTYLLPDYSWRNAIARSYLFDIPKDTQVQMINEAFSIYKNHSDELIPFEQLYNDSSESAGAIPRQRKTHVACQQILVLDDKNNVVVNLHFREDSDVLLNSLIYKTLSSHLNPFEKIEQQTGLKKTRKLP